MNNLPSPTEVRKRARILQKPIKQNDVDVAFNTIATAFTKENKMVFSFKGSEFMANMRVEDKQEVLKRIAQTPGYYVKLNFNGDLFVVPKYVFDWPEMWAITYDHFENVTIFVEGYNEWVDDK